MRRFVSANQRTAAWIERRLPHAHANLPEVWAETVAREMKALPPGGLVVDVGGGRSCLFARHREPGDDVRIVGVDISDEELAHNDDVDEKVVADIVEGLPFDDASADMIVSRSVIEHLVDSEALVAHAARVLKPNGWFIGLFPSKYAPFSLANRALPEPVAQRLLYAMWPGSEGIVGFPTHYDNCSANGMGRVLGRHGFEVVETHVNYYQSEYFAFFLPAYLLSVLYELVIWRLGVKQLGASVLVAARKR